ncbi:MAG: hypothetical protein KTR22_07475 [Flavobacteriaceae bacterium]|nr:hypothetical protein [Flavobacteriaceae bacterium]
MSLKPAKEIIPNIIMVVLGVFVMTLCFFHLDSVDRVFKELTGIIRVIVALAAACISIALPGFVELETKSESRNAPLIKAGGALAVFVIVYLFNPIG